MSRRRKTPPMQLTIGDRFLNLSERGQKVILNSELGHFGDEVFTRINVDDYRVLYSDEGRGPTYLQGLIAATYLFQSSDMSVDDLIMHIETDIAYQYALHTTSADKQPFSRRNMFYFLAKLDAYKEETGIDLIKQTFDGVTGSFAKDMGLDKPCGEKIKRRMDSMMIDSTAARLPRTGIIYVTNQDAVKLFVGLMGKEYLPTILYHYLDESDQNEVIYHNKGGQREKLAKLLGESKVILDLMSEEEWHEFQQYKNLKRCILDQGTITADGTVIPKENKEIKGNSLQSPKDPGATARTKNRQTYVGRVGNFTETYDGNGNALITAADIRENTYSDSEFMSDYIEAKEDDNPEQVITDGAYYSAENAKKAEDKGITIIPTSLTGTETNPLCGDFTLDEDGKQVITCPNGLAPFEQVYHEDTDVIDAKFDHEQCDQCPFRDQCPGKSQKKSVKVSISAKMVDRATLQEEMKTEEYKDFGRERNAVESIPSILRRKFGADHIQTRRDSRIRSSYFSKCLAYNCIKHKRFLDRQRVNYAFA